MTAEQVEAKAREFVVWFSKRQQFFLGPVCWFRFWADGKSFSQADRDAILREVLSP